jgi:hypothetical protein
MLIVSKSRILLSALLLIPAIANAGGKNPILDEKFSIALGTHLLTGNTEITTQSTIFNNRKFEIDNEDLGLDSDVDSYWLDAKWRPFERWSFMAEFYSYSEDGTNTRGIETVFKDTVFGANTSLDTSFDVDIFSLSTAYRLVDEQNYAIDIGGGFHTLDLSFSIEGTVTGVAGNNVATTSSGREVSDFVAPLPNLMVFGTYALNEQWALSGRMGWLSLNYEDYEGDLLRANLVVDFRPFENVGIGAGYNFSDMELTRDHSTGIESFRLDFSGPIIYLKAGF